MEQGMLRPNYISPNSNPYRSSPHELSINTSRENCSRSVTSPLHSPISGYSSFHPSTDQPYQMNRQNSHFGLGSQQSLEPTYTSLSKRYETNLQIQPSQNGAKYPAFRENQTDNIGRRMSTERHNRHSSDEFGSKEFSDYKTISNSSVNGSDDEIESKDMNKMLQTKPQKMIRSGKASKSLLSNTEKCKVCLAQAARHVHYGSTTCYSCKAFFRRSIQLGAAFKYTCQTQGNCVMLPNTRKSCQRCRFDRCLAIGMKPDRVLTEKQRAKRFRKVRQKMSKDSNNKEGTMSNAVEKGHNYPNSPSPSGSLSDGGNNRSFSESDQFHPTSGPRQRPFLDDWFFDNDFHSNENRRENIPNVEQNFMAQKQSLNANNMRAHIKEGHMSDSNSAKNLDAVTESNSNDNQMHIKAEPMDSDSNALDSNVDERNVIVDMNNLDHQKETVRSNCTPPMPIKTEKDEFLSQAINFPSGRAYEKNHISYDTRMESEDTRLSLVHPSRNGFKKLRMESTEDSSRPIDMSPTALAKAPTIDVRYPLKSGLSIPPLCPIDERDKYARPHYTINTPGVSRTTTYNNAPVSSVLPIAHSSSHRVIFNHI